MSIHEYEKPSVTTDMVLFRIGPKESTEKRKVDEKRKIDEGELQVLLVKRKDEPQKGYLALPGGFVNINEEIGANVLRKLQEKTGVTGDFYMEQLYTKGEIGRDPRGRIISVSYLGLCNEETYDNSNLAPDAAWYSVEYILRSRLLAFDHDQIVLYAFNRVKNKMDYTDIAFNLLPSEFTITDCQIAYEIFVGKAIQNFRRKISDYVIPLNKKQEGKAFRPAELFTLNKDRKSHF